MHWLEGMLTTDSAAPLRAVLYRRLLIVAVCVAASTAEINTIPGFWGQFEIAAAAASHAAWGVAALDWVVRLVGAWGAGGAAVLSGYAFGLTGIVDAVVFFVFLAETAAPLSPEATAVAGIAVFLKLARYSPALETLAAVLRSEMRPLASALFIMILLVMTASIVLFFVERGINPGFASVPHAMWWSVVTLATLGYGDVVPISAPGKVLGGMVGILGLGMFALPASILASGFTEEMRRRNFIDTWHLVAKVPLFKRFQATDIAAVTSMLKVRPAMRGEVLMHEGDQGDSMYFIVSGQVDVLGPNGSAVLKAGDFFGEIALLDDRPRTATVRALTRCNLLVLSAGDFQKFIQSSPDLAAAMRETAKARLGDDKKGDAG